ncbi:MAG: radical SAM protein [Candidatus Scalinduaceae bacterium]
MLTEFLAFSIRYLKYKRFQSAPIWITFDITWNCNCRCDYCNYWKEGHVDLSTGEIKRIIKNLKTMGVMYLGLSGGEPLLRKDVPEIVGYAKGLGMHVGLNTNGTVGKIEVYRTLMEKGIDTICFSIDGAKASTHERFRKNCSFKKVVNSIRETVRIRNRGNYRTNISTNTVIHRANVDDLEEISRIRSTLGVDRNNFQPVWYCNVDVKGDEFNSKIGFSYEDGELLKKVSKTIDTLPDGNLKSYNDLLPYYYTDYKRVRDIECFAGRAFAYVDPKGILYPCSILLEPLGSLLEEDNKTFLRSSKVKKILKKTAVQNCKGCSMVCYMERNIMLNNIFNPFMLREILFKRYLALIYTRERN